MLILKIKNKKNYTYKAYFGKKIVVSRPYILVYIYISCTKQWRIQNDFMGNYYRNKNISTT